jgi:hypothetical protein
MERSGRSYLVSMAARTHLPVDRDGGLLLRSRTAGTGPAWSGARLEYQIEWRLGYAPEAGETGVGDNVADPRLTGLST